MSATTARSLSLVSAANVVAAAIGFGQAVVVVRTLDVAGYGVLAILASVVAVAVNLLDVRVTDLASRLFFAAPERASGAAPSRLDVLAGAALVQAAVGVAVATLAGGALLAFSDVLLGAAAPAPALLVLYACAEGLLVPLGNVLALVQRLRERFAVMAATHVAAAALRAALVLGALALRPDPAGVVVGIAAAALAGVTLHLAVAVWIEGGEAARVVRPRIAGRAFWGERRTLLSLGLVNYQNLLHRAADVLAVGLVAGEAAAGLYRFARTCTDALYALVLEAASKVYQPLLLRLLAGGEAGEFRRRAGQLVRAAALLVLLGLAAEGFVLDDLVAWAVGPRFLPAVPAIALLTVPVFFVVGLGLWTWPLLVHARRVDAFVRCSSAAVVVGQYALPLAGVALSGGDAVTWFALGYVLYYLILYGTLLPRLVGIRADALPSLVAPLVRGTA